MANSAAGPQFVTGRVIVGTGSPGGGITTVQALEGKRPPVWDQDADQVYLNRVKDRAQLLAQEIIAKAMADAEALRAEAREQARQEGLAAASQEVLALHQELAQSVGHVIAAIRNQGRTLLARQAQDIVELVRLAVRKAIGCELSEHRTTILGRLLNEALESIDSQRRLTISVRPEDKPFLDDLLAAAAMSNPALAGVTVLEAPDLSMGGLILESDEGLVDNSLASRFEVVEDILDQLSFEPEAAGLGDDTEAAAQAMDAAFSPAPPSMSTPQASTPAMDPNPGIHPDADPTLSSTASEMDQHSAAPDAEPQEHAGLYAGNPANTEFPMADPDAGLNTSSALAAEDSSNENEFPPPPGAQVQS